MPACLPAVAESVSTPPPSAPCFLRKNMERKCLIWDTTKYQVDKWHLLNHSWQRITVLVTNFGWLWATAWWQYRNMTSLFHSGVQCRSNASASSRHLLSHLFQLRHLRLCFQISEKGRFSMEVLFWSILKHRIWMAKWFADHNWKPTPELEASDVTANMYSLNKQGFARTYPPCHPFFTKLIGTPCGSAPWKMVPRSVSYRRTFISFHSVACRAFNCSAVSPRPRNTIFGDIHSQLNSQLFSVAFSGFYGLQPTKRCVFLGVKFRITFMEWYFLGWFGWFLRSTCHFMFRLWRSTCCHLLVLRSPCHAAAFGSLPGGCPPHPSPSSGVGLDKAQLENWIWGI